VYDDWVPKKLEIELQVPTDLPVDLERFRGSNCELQAGESPIASAPDAAGE